ncbi:hypothetical protein C7B89_19940 [Lysinibacillus capsici]|nr:hypothetical protein C7B89_19940 [Lysinibacillus capsici]
MKGGEEQVIYVTNGNQVEPLNSVSNFEMEQEIKGNYSITFSSFKNNNPAYPILVEESVVTVNDFDFRVKQLKETRHGKQIIALSTFFDLVDKRQNEIYGGTHTFNEFMTFVLKDTGWTFTSDITGSRLIENFGENNVIAMINALCQTYKCEFVILSNNRVHFSNKIGGDYDAQYRYGHNVQALSKNVDTTKLKTYVEGYGATNESGGQLWVSYTSPNEEKFGKREADPIYDDRFSNADSLLEHMKSQLIDYPEVTFELDSIELLDKELGERVWLIYEPLDMEFQTRILSLTKQFVNGKLRTTKVVLGNTVPKSTNDILISQKVEIDENKKITRSKFEQTNDRITMEVEEIGESIGQLEIKSNEINLKVEQNTKSIGEVNIKADQINLSVNNRITNEVATINIRADQIQSTVTAQGTSINGLGNRLSNAESSITQNAYNISLKVSATDFTGANIVSKINLDPWSATIQASKINLVGAVRVLSDITGDLGSIYAGNIYGANINVSSDATIGNNLYLGTSGWGSKSVNFGGGNGIYYNGEQMTFSAPYLNFSGSNNTLNGYNTIYGTLNVPYSTNLSGVVRAESSGIGISYSGGYLYVKVNGSTMGSVKLT